MTAQEVFTKAKDHLLKQGFKCTFDKTSSSPRPGLYKRNDGAACPVGIFIPQNEYKHINLGPMVLPYDPTLEYRTVIEIWREGHNKLSQATKDFLFEHMKLLTDLQNLHDLIPVKQWENELQVIAKKHNLEY